MKIAIGETIRQLRRDRELTQEEVASHLGISPQSISKWERGEGYPDITMLPVMAHYFHISVDTLLGLAQTEEQYRQLNQQWQENHRNGLHDENVTLMRKALERFPNDALLLVQLSSSLEHIGEIHQSIAVQEQILRYISDSEVRGATLYNICFSYAKVGETDKALETALKLPNLYKARENALAYFLQGTQKAANARQSIAPLIWAIRRHLGALAEVENKPEYQQLAEEIAKTLAGIAPSESKITASSFAAGRGG